MQDGVVKLGRLY